MDTSQVTLLGQLPKLCREQFPNCLAIFSILCKTTYVTPKSWREGFCPRPQILEQWLKSGRTSIPPPKDTVELPESSGPTKAASTLPFRALSIHPSPVPVMKLASPVVSRVLASLAL